MKKELFEENRKKILDQMVDNSILISFSRKKEESIVNEKYNVNRNYFYLCGILEFENIVVLSKLKGHDAEIIFINPYDEHKAKWVGAPMSKEAVIENSGIHSVLYLENFENTIYRMCDNAEVIYLDLPKNSISATLTEDELFAKIVKEKNPWIHIKNAQNLFMKARTIKSPIEIEEIKKAIDITNQGVKAIMANMHQAYEYQIESYFDQAIKYYGATGYSFPTIAASGKNACCLHYSDNNSLAKNGDLILFDLGASLNMYCADITRTFPVSGVFTERQKQIYNIVLNGQRLVFEHIKPGITTRALNDKLVEYYAVELKKIGLIQDSSEVSKYYYHGVSHHLGLDCHDLCEYTALQPGSIISNEPGLYISEEGIGIRIEDDVLVTEDGAAWLSPQIIKTVEDIENFMKNNRR